MANTMTENSEVHLSDVVRIALPASAEIIAAQEYGRKAVGWLSIAMSNEQLDEQVRADDVVILPSDVQKALSNSELSQFIRALTTRDCAALILFTRPVKSVREVAIQLSLPLLLITDDTSLRDVHKSIAALLLDRQTQVSERGMRLYRDLAEMSRDSKGLNKMAEAIGKVTGKIVVIQDKRLDLQALYKPAGSSDIDEAALRDALSTKDSLPPVLRNRKAAARSNITHWQQLLLPNVNIGRLISPIISGDRARGYLSIVGAEAELDLLDAVAVEQGSAACALEMAKAKAISEAQKALRGNFLEGILAGNIPQNEIDRLAARLDHDTDLPHAVMTFRWPEGSALSLRRIETTLNWLLASSNWSTLVHIYGEDHICVFQTLRSAEDLTPAKRLAKQLREQLGGDSSEDRVLGGLTGPVLSLSDWPEAHREALQALGVGERLNLHEIVEYSSLGVYQLLGQLDNIPAVSGFCDLVIGPLVDYDREHRSNLVKTIEEYFKHHGNVSQTAEALFIHRNTLLYRIERIQDLTGHELSQSDMRLALHLALKLWQLRPET